MEPASSVSAWARLLAWLAGVLVGGVPGLIGRLARLAGGVPCGLDGVDRISQICALRSSLLGVVRTRIGVVRIGRITLLASGWH